MSKRLQDQLLILAAVKVVRQELDKCDPANWLEQGEILVRLVTLYSLLDVEKLSTLVLEADVRPGKEKAA